MASDFGFDPYEGNEPFVFICYKTEDEKIVGPIARGLRDRGVNVWYDRGIKDGQTWREVIADHIERCSVLLAFPSQNFYKLKPETFPIRSETLRELELATDEFYRQILRIDLETVNNPPT